MKRRRERIIDLGSLDRGLPEWSISGCAYMQAKNTAGADLGFGDPAYMDGVFVTDRHRPIVLLEAVPAESSFRGGICYCLQSIPLNKIGLVAVAGVCWAKFARSSLDHHFLTVSSGALVSSPYGGIAKILVGDVGGVASLGLIQIGMFGRFIADVRDDGVNSLDKRFVDSPEGAWTPFANTEDCQ